MKGAFTDARTGKRGLFEDADGGTGRAALAPGPDDLSMKRAQRALEAELIGKALQHTGGNRTRAAELLELSLRALLYRIRDYGIE